MARLMHILITLPLMAVPVSLLAADSAHAATLSQMDALRLLAKSKAADTKCRVLAPADSDELGSYLARAEVAVTQRGSVQDAQGTIAVGRSLGDGAACDSRTAAEITDTLDAARRAMAAVAERETTREQDSKRPRRVAVETERTAATRQPVTVKHYRDQAFAYYLERRCQHLSAREARSFWKSIVRQHKAALRNAGGKAVASALRKAEISADGMSCGAQSRRIVRAEFSQSSDF